MVLQSIIYLKKAYNYCKLFLALILFFQLPLPAQTEDWFTDIQYLPNGYMVKELSIYDSGDQFKFILAKLSYNRLRGWEEMRITGKAVFSKEKINLLPALCNNFAIPSFAKRMTIIRTYECDHLGFVFFPLKKGLLSPAFELINEEYFFHHITEKKFKKSAIVVGEAVLWGNDLKYIRKPIAIITKEKTFYAEMISRTDTSVSFKELNLPLGTVVALGER